MRRTRLTCIEIFQRKFTCYTESHNELTVLVVEIVPEFLSTAECDAVFKLDNTFGFGSCSIA